MQGILLAAGYGSRFFDANGVHQDKLLAQLPSRSHSVLWHSAHALITALPDSVAVVQANQVERKQVLHSLGFQIVESARAKNGMGYAIADAVSATIQAEAWLIAMADMPWMHQELISRLCEIYHQPNQIIAPRYNGQRGHPVIFGANWGQDLTQLIGDKGARDLLKSASVDWLDWHDNSIHRDVDTAADIL